MRKGIGFLILLALAAAAASEELRPASELASISDEAERSAALFVEAGKVLQHPRCLNCHPAGESPFQGEEVRVHEPPVSRGLGGHGVVGMRCATCHLEENFDPGRVPGAPHWHLAPAKMAWQGKSLGEICAQLKDPEQNGDRDLKEVVRHMSEDPLVGWAWTPGAGREPAPGTQEVFARLIREWVSTGAVCPSDG